jgi:hypothetical protein
MFRPYCGPVAADGGGHGRTGTRAPTAPDSSLSIPGRHAESAADTLVRIQQARLSGRMRCEPAWLATVSLRCATHLRRRSERERL